MKVKFLNKNGKVLYEDTKEDCAFWYTPAVSMFINDILYNFTIKSQTLEMKEETLYIYLDTLKGKE
jgi:hypothetical protein